MQTLSLVNKTAKVANHTFAAMGQPPSLVLKDISSGAGAALSCLSIVSLPSFTKSAVRSVRQIFEDDGVATSRKILKAVRLSAIAATCFLSSLTFLALAPAFQLSSKVISLSGEFSDLSRSLTDYNTVSEYERLAKGESKEALAHSKNYYRLRLIKNITAIASGLLALFALLTKTSLVPALVTATISLIVTVRSMQRDLFKSSGRFAIIPFDHPLALA